MGKFKDLDIQQHNVDPVKSRRGKNARNRGNAFERFVALKLGGRRVGHFGGKADATGGEGDWLQVQCKVGGSFSERQWGWLQSVPVKGDQLRGLVIGDSPGAGGGRRRAVILLDLDDFAAWFVGSTQEPPE
jgi:hypothetical protein